MTLQRSETGIISTPPLDLIKINRGTENRPPVQSFLVFADSCSCFLITGLIPVAPGAAGILAGSLVRIAAAIHDLAGRVTSAIGSVTAVCQTVTIIVNPIVASGFRAFIRHADRCILA